MHVIVNANTQELAVYDAKRLICTYKIATAANGLGEQIGSEQTPRGWHEVHAKLGDGCELGAVFHHREPTGEIYSTELDHAHPARDWILSRIIWLSGAEPGFNQHGAVDTKKRFIYIHGTPDEIPMGTPSSHGCIRMHNQDVIELYEYLENGDRVLVREK